MAAAKKHAWLKFYPQDWRGDAKLRSCSIGARGLWVEMICIMHEAEPYGHLMLGATPVSNRQLAALAGISTKEVMTFLAELGSAGVFSRDANGIVVSRRMVRDFEKAQRGRDDANKRWGNGTPTALPNGLPTTNPITPDTRSHIEDRIGARASLFTEGSKALTDAFWKAVGCTTPLDISPDYAGVDWRALEWERAGWTADLIDAETRRIGPGKPLKYYEKVFATAFAKRQAPLPVVQIQEAEKLTVKANGKTGSKIIQASDDLRRKIASFDGPAGQADDICSGEGSASTRLLPHG